MAENPEQKPDRSELHTGKYIRRDCRAWAWLGRFQIIPPNRRGRESWKYYSMALCAGVSTGDFDCTHAPGGQGQAVSQGNVLVIHRQLQAPWPLTTTMRLDWSPAHGQGGKVGPVAMASAARTRSRIRLTRKVFMGES